MSSGDEVIFGKSEKRGLDASGCDEKQAKSLAAQKRKALIIALLAVSATVTIPVLAYALASDGIVTVKFDDNISMPAFTAIGFGEWHVGDATINFPAGGDGTLYRIAEVRILFSELSKLYSSSQIMQEFCYGDTGPTDVPALDDYFDQNAIFGRSIVFTPGTLANVSGQEFSFRVPRGSSIIACIIVAEAMNHTNSYSSNTIFSTRFCKFFGKEHTTEVGYLALSLNITSISFDASALSAWEDYIVKEIKTTVPTSYPWNIAAETAVEMGASVFDTNVR